MLALEGIQINVLLTAHAVFEEAPQCVDLLASTYSGETSNKLVILNETLQALFSMLQDIAAIVVGA